ncbi:Conserved_hypothetical protein [Hexamita inflata]|uniref:Transmembrane protein n=1 Tax=Hexamita inflata TaxID=28002 RepID=A0AA86PEY2_9EUKA|nr:Conserved hypothetical protein [Hexamita inflata]
MKNPYCAIENRQWMAIASIMISFILYVLQGKTSEISALTIIEDCYSDLSRVILKEDQKQICLQLITASNSKCNALPKGVKLSIELDNIEGFYTPTGYFSDFNYSSTTELCVSCTAQACIDHIFFESKSASASIESYGYTAPISVGIVIREQLDLVNCINESHVVVYSTKIDLISKINDYCWQLLTSNSYIMLNNSQTIKLSGIIMQDTYVPGSPDISFSASNTDKTFIFTSVGTDVYQVFDTYDFIGISQKICLQLSNTVNCLETSTNKVEISGLTPGYSQLRLRINENNMQLAGTPSAMGKLYNQLAAVEKYDAYHIKLQILFGQIDYFFESRDVQSYEEGQTQSFTCSTEKLFYMCTITLIRQLALAQLQALQKVEQSNI